MLETIFFTLLVVTLIYGVALACTYLCLGASVLWIKLSDSVQQLFQRTKQ